MNLCPDAMPVDEETLERLQLSWIINNNNIDIQMDPYIFQGQEQDK